MVACASNAYLQQHGMPAQATDLLHHRMLGFDTSDAILQGFATMGQPIQKGQFCLRTDDMLAYWQAVRAGMGVGFVAAYMVASDPQVHRVLPELTLPSLPIWLTVHREIRSSPRIRAVYDFLAEAVPAALDSAHTALHLRPTSDQPT
jgi:DNA-binding transcriptional LysR family regulator